MGKGGVKPYIIASFSSLRGELVLLDARCVQK